MIAMGITLEVYREEGGPLETQGFLYSVFKFVIMLLVAFTHAAIGVGTRLHHNSKTQDISLICPASEFRHICCP
jgi:hypothetical protein